MVKKRFSSRIQIILIITLIFPAIIGGTMGILFMNHTEEQIKKITRQELYNTTFNDIESNIQSTSKLMEDYFHHYNNLAKNVKYFTENLLSRSVYDQNFNLSMIKKSENITGLFEDIGVGDIHLLKDINLTREINLTIMKLSSAHTYFDSLIDSDNSILYSYMSIEPGIDMLYPFFNLTLNLDAGFDPRLRPWYINAKGNENNEPVWSIYIDEISEEMIASVSISLINNSEFVGVVGMDIHLSSINQRLSDLSYKDNGYTLLLNESLHIMAKTILDASNSCSDDLLTSDNISISENSGLYQNFLNAYSNRNGSFTISVKTSDGTPNQKFVFYQKLEKVNLLFCVIVPSEIISIQADQIADLLILANSQYLLSQIFIAIGFILIIYILAIIFLGVGIQKYTLPIEIFRKEKEKSEEQIRKSEEDYRKLFNNSPIGLYRTTLDGQFLAVNNKFIRMLGYTDAKSFENVNIQEISGKIGYPREKFLEIVNNEEEIFGLEFKINRIDGKPIHIRENVRVVKKGEDVMYYEGSFEDITERVLAEETRKEYIQRREDFISMTTHELRTPLTSIRGYTEVLEKRKDMNQEDREHLYKIIHKNISRLESLIKGVSDLTQIEKRTFNLNKKQFDFLTLIDELMNDYKLKIGDQIINSNKISSSTNQFLINADKDRIEQIITNLIDNAIKHTPHDNKKIEIAFKIIDQNLELTIEDNGAGIPNDVIESIFTQFVSIPTIYSAKGTGIGLYISRQLAEAHRGSLTAYSEGKGKGSIFTLKIPL